MCTRLFKSGRIRRRWFTIYDKNKPYELILTLYREIPKIEFYPLCLPMPGIGIFLFPIIKTSHTELKTFRMENKEEAELILGKINKGFDCIKCGQPEKCNQIDPKLDLQEIP